MPDTATEHDKHNGAGGVRENSGILSNVNKGVQQKWFLDFRLANITARRAPLLERKPLLLAALEEERLLPPRDGVALFLFRVTNRGSRAITLRTLRPDSGRAEGTS